MELPPQGKVNSGINSILADDKAVQSRGLDGNLVDWVQVKEIGTLLDHIVEDNTRVAWF